MPEEEGEAIELHRLQSLKRAKKKSYIIKGGLIAAALIILGFIFGPQEIKTLNQPLALLLNPLILSGICIREVPHFQVAGTQTS